ncbi:MAG: spore coat protein CotJB [Oscillospiraceae bacterium]|nr:spore coat protein CotJB [Oscillospiraceae bacterium]
MNRKKLLKKIQEYCFAIKELELFLDTHPNCEKALKLFNSYKKQKEEAVAEYNAKYGPLQSVQSSEKKWDWVDGPWPWEKGGNE